MITQKERAAAIMHDLLVNHLSRIKEGLEKGYVDENQILLVYDHAVRARILTEHSAESDPKGADSKRQEGGFIHLNAKQKDLVIVWAKKNPDGDMWGNSDARAINLTTFARAILSEQTGTAADSVSDGGRPS